MPLARRRLHGLMQDDKPLLIQNIIDHAARVHGTREITSRWCSDDAATARTTYGEARLRAGALAAALTKDLGCVRGDRVASLCFNHGAHFDAYFGVPGAGLVLHTVNPRLYEHQLAYIFTHAAPTAILVDGGFADLLARVLALCGADYAPRAVVVVPDGRPGDDRATRTAEASARGWLEYDALLERRLGEDVAWADDLDETAASGLCYTSGTTGDPKGCLFSHRSTMLHTLFSLTAPSMGLRKADAALPFVPMFHVNAWGLPWAAALAGSKLCLLAGPLDGAVAGSYAADEGVTFAAGVPTVFMALADGLEARRDAALFSADGRVVVGGAATPPALAERYEARGCHVVRSWGMTELSPVGVMGPHRDDGIGRADADAPVAAGFELFGVELRVVDDGGAALPRDGSSQGELEVRGPATIRRYYGAAEDACDADGWFKTGDVATISSTGALAIRDRAKDVAHAHDAIDSSDGPGAAVIAAPHDAYGERPVLVARLKPGRRRRQELLDFYVGKVAKWWIPDDVIFFDGPLPLTGTGDPKLELRKLLLDDVLPAKKCRRRP
ncbi:ligase [Aureococcus anophagefferens]|nr:ligase [Aureococcus anophagefferens]